MHTTSAAPSVFSLIAASVTLPASILRRLGASRRRQREHALFLQSYNDLIANADEHILRDIGVTRGDLFRMRAELFQND